MVNKNKKTKVCDKGSEEENKISELPDALITDNILVHLSTKDAVRTSVLSTKWRNLWKWVPGLDLNSHEFSNFIDFVNFGDRIFDSHRESWIRKLRLCIYDSSGNKSYFRSWIDAVAKSRIQHIDFRFEAHVRPTEIPLSIYTCETLVQLRVYLAALVSAEYVSLPCLKIIHLERVSYLNKATVEKLISGSSVLEDLTIIDSRSNYENVIQVRSQTLKRIRIDKYTKVVIDAPLLQCFKTQISNDKNFKFISSGFPDKVDIDVSVVFHKFDPNIRIMFRDILTDISKVRELVISTEMWKGMFLYSKSEPLLQFRYLSRLTASFYTSDLEMLPTLLENCPKLESLLLSYCRKDKEPNVRLSAVPRCLVTSLKFVELKRSKSMAKYYEGEMELVRYFLKNSVVLQKLRLDSYYYRKKAKYDILKELLAMPRCSSTCEVLLL